MISCYQLTVSKPRDGGLLFDEATFEIADGVWVEIQGPTGSGKTLLFNLLSLRARKPSTKLIITGRNVDRLGPDGWAELRESIGSCPEVPEFLDDRSLVENLLVPFVARGVHEGAYEIVRDALVRADMENFADVKVRNLSLTERNAAGVLRALVGRPELVLLDEILPRTGRFRPALEAMLAETRDEGSTIVAFALVGPPAKHVDEVFMLDEAKILGADISDETGQ